MSDALLFFVNGKKVVESNADPETTLLVYLRENLRLTGTKLGCGEGGCGACTVMVSKWVTKENRIQHFSVNACLAPIISVHQCAVTTVEGIGSTKTKLHEVQERLARYHGSQCGFCTPGIVMSMYTLLRKNADPTTKKIDKYLQGNLCRCTGYRPILAAFQTFSNTTPKSNLCSLGNKCCKMQEKKLETNDNVVSEFIRYDPTQEPIFPPELKMLSKSDLSSLTFVGERCTWHQPTNLLQLLKLRKDNPDSRIVGGNTEIGIETTIKGFHYPVLISPANVKEMKKIEVLETGIKIGGACSLTEIQNSLQKCVANNKPHEVEIFKAVLEMLHWFSGEQIRNVGTIGGNIMTASPISDINPILMAAKATLFLAKEDNGKITMREIPVDENFFQSYRKMAVEKDEVLISIKIPYTTKSKRRDDDIAIVNAAFYAIFEENSSKVKHFASSFGGMADRTVLSLKVMESCIGRNWDNSLQEEISMLLTKDHILSGDAPGGMVDYRKTLVQSIFFKFFMTVSLELQKLGVFNNGQVREDSISAVTDFKRNDQAIESVQVWDEVAEDQSNIDTVGRPEMHISGFKHATGEAKYVDDMPHCEGELYLSFVISSVAHARILSVDISEAFKVQGFVTYVDHLDVPGSNIVWRGDPVFADNEVTSVGQIIGAVVADNQTHARRAARLIKVEYENLPAIITIKDAIQQSSYYEPAGRLMVSGDVDKAFTESDHVVEGEVRLNGQEHFYLETHSCIVIPKPEDDEIEIFAATQALTLCQMSVSGCLGVPSHKVKVHTKRLGGGFGGKETRSFLLPTCLAVAAKKCNKPIRCMLTRHEDMQMTGGRHPYYFKYKIGFNKNGKINALDETIYNNGGHTLDMSQDGMTKSIYEALNAYCFPNVRVRGYACKTNTPSNTPLRGFGKPQAMLCAETWITHVASFLGMDAEKVRDLNLIKKGELTHYNQSHEDESVVKCWNACLRKSNFQDRKLVVEEFNSKNRWRKRGISCIPTAYGIGFPTFLNQGGALVNIYIDGTVLVSHGGIEMGQGLHTKMIQIASRVLKIPCSKIHISETTSDIIPNASPSVASSCSDLYGMAVKIACEKLKKRLEPIESENPTWPWEKVIGTAYMSRTALFATGFYKTPDINTDLWDIKTGKVEGQTYNYYTCGAAVSEVEIDCLTGDHIVLQTDIVMDLGRSLNPAVDIGQIEGAFVQGYGLMTLEDPLYSQTGKIWTLGPGAYKIPGFDDIPRKFNVHLLPNTENKRAVYSSKAVGEPPLFLASSIFFAIRNAIASARHDAGHDEYFCLDSPASCESIRMACLDDITKKVKKSKDDLQSWSIRICK